MSRSSYFCITLNNYTEFDVLYYRSLVGRGLATFAIFGYEVGASGTRHLQAYFELPNRIRLTGARRLWPRAHIENRRGTAQEARDYCAKDGQYEEYGNLSNPRQGNRTDLEELKNALKDKRSLEYICDEHFGQFLKYQKGINAARLIYANQRNIDCPPCVIVYWGRTGTGKTRAIWDNASSKEDVWVYPGTGWFDGYQGQKIALFDDFGGSEFKISYLLKLLDRYPMRVPVKGNFVEWAPEEIYITSNLNPRSWYSGAHRQHVEAMFRRFTNIVEFQ